MTTILAELEALSDRIRRIRPVGRNGDLGPFYEDRSEAASDARALADWQRTGKPPADYVPAASRIREERRDSFSRRR